MSVLKERFRLNDGRFIPSLGIGFWQVPTEDAARVVQEGFLEGYRLVDTAIDYGNEKEIGLGLKESGLPRESYFLTSKIPAHIKTGEEAKDMIRKSIRDLGVEYLDLMLIHSPKPWPELHNPDTPYRYERENLEVWKAMEEAQRAGLVRSLGVSNFEIGDLENILENASIPPAVNQIPCFVGHIDEELISFCKSRNILVEAYSPLATGRLLANDSLAQLAKKYGADTPRLCLRFLLQMGLVPLPKTTHRAFMKTNAQLDFTLSDEDYAFLKSWQGR